MATQTDRQLILELDNLRARLIGRGADRDLIERTIETLLGMYSHGWRTDTGASRSPASTA